MLYPVGFYFWKALAQGTEWEFSFYLKKNEKESWATLPEFIVKVVFFALTDFTFSDILPKAIWGTKDVGIYADWLLKKSSVMILMSWAVNSRFFEDTIKKLCNGDVISKA